MSFVRGNIIGDEERPSELVGPGSSEEPDIHENSPAEQKFVSEDDSEESLGELHASTQRKGPFQRVSVRFPAVAALVRATSHNSARSSTAGSPIKKAKEAAVASWKQYHKPSNKLPTKKKKFFSLRPEAPRIQLNRFLLTFKYNGEQLSNSSSLCRIFDNFFSPLELEYIRWRQDQELTSVRHASVFAMIMTIFFLVAASSGGNTGGKLLKIEKGKREYEYMSIFMLFICVLFTRCLYKYCRSFFVLRYNLLMPTSLWIFIISHCHLARALMYPNSISFYQFSIGWLHPFWMAVMATGVGLTFSFFLVVSSIFTASHILTLYWLRASYMRGDFVALSDGLAAELAGMQDQYDNFGASLTDFTGFGGLWLFTAGTWMVFCYINRASDIGCRNHFIQLKRLNQMDAQRVRLHVDWGAGISRVQDRLKARFGRAGAVLFRYELPFEIDLQALVKGKKIGAGASGVVYEGYFGRTQVAIKSVCISDLCALEPESAVEEAKGEAEILGKLAHENILKFHGVCGDADNLYIVTELCAGDLRDRVYNAGKAEKSAAVAKRTSLKGGQDGTISVQEMVRFMLEISSGCAYLHDNGIVHRDLKPGNVLLTEKGRCKICDFGQSKDYASGADENEMTANIGTPVFCAPEVNSESRVSQYSTKIDVYSFGIMIWMIYTKERPYHDSSCTSNWALLAAIIKGLRPTIPPDMPPRLVALMVACWAEEPEERPTFSEVISRLDGGARSLFVEEAHGGSINAAPNLIIRGANIGVRGAGGNDHDVQLEAMAPEGKLPSDAEATGVMDTVLANPLFEHLDSIATGGMEAQQ
jgi:hypothetical protein